MRKFLDRYYEFVVFGFALGNLAWLYFIPRNDLGVSIVLWLVWLVWIAIGVCVTIVGRKNK